MAYRPPPQAPLRVLYQDAHLIAIDKPSGLLSVPGRGEDKQDCLLSRVREVFPEALVVHRLDMGTSGLMLFALSTAVQSAIGHLFETRKIDKTYIARVRGVPEPAMGDIDLPLTADWPRRPRQKVDHEMGKVAHTHYRVVEQAADGSTARLLLEPTTGRSHQLRVHLAESGHPILGDELYADEATLGLANRLLLHAERLRLPHPREEGDLEICCQVPF